MGAELIVNVLAHKADTTLDWNAGRTSIRNQSFDQDDVIEDYFYNGDYDPDGPFDEDDYREYLIGLLDDLERGLQNDRTVNEFGFGEWVIILCGGTSWGDSPSDTFNRINDLLQDFETALAPVGFGWPESA